MSLQEAQSDEGSAPSRTRDGGGRRVSDGILPFWGLGAGLAGGQGRVHAGPAHSHGLCETRGTPIGQVSDQTSQPVAVGMGRPRLSLIGR